MARYGENGWPVGTICELVQSRYAEYLYEMCEVIGERKWHTKEQCWTYEVHLYKADKWYVVAETQLKFNNLPRKWETWAENKVTMLLNIDPKVAYQLKEEQEREQRK